MTSDIHPIQHNNKTDFYLEEIFSQQMKTSTPFLKLVLNEFSSMVIIKPHDF
jgi:hypothetical protein